MLHLTLADHITVLIGLLIKQFLISFPIRFDDLLKAVFMKEWITIQKF